MRLRSVHVFYVSVMYLCTSGDFLLFILICSRTSEVEGKAFGAKQFLLFADSEACRIHERSADLHRTQKKLLKIPQIKSQSFY